MTERAIIETSQFGALRLSKRILDAGYSISYMQISIGVSTTTLLRYLVGNLSTQCLIVYRFMSSPGGVHVQPGSNVYGKWVQ